MRRYTITFRTPETLDQPVDVDGLKSRAVIYGCGGSMGRSGVFSFSKWWRSGPTLTTPSPAKV